MFFCGKYFNFIILIISYKTIYGFYSNYESVTTEHNPDLVKFLDLRIVNTTNRNAINGSVIYNQDLDAFSVGFHITCINRNGNPWTLMNFTVDGCEYIENASRKSKKFPYLFVSELRKTNPDFPNKCPIKKDKEILIRNFYVGIESTYINFPEMNFNAKVLLKQRGERIFKMILIGSIKNN